MQKLPVFATYGNALAFAFTNFFTVLRLSWFPLVMMTAGFYVIGLTVQHTMAAGLPPGGQPTPLELFRHLDQFAIIWVAMMLLQAIAVTAIAVSIHRVILFNDRKPGEFFAFAFGRAEWLFMVAIFFWLFFGLALAAAIIGPALYVVADGDIEGFIASFKYFPENMEPIFKSGRFGILLAAYIVFWIACLALFLRLSLWPPTIVATGRLSLGEAWALTRGNAMRMFGLFFLMAITLWIVMVALLFSGVLPAAMRHVAELRDATGPQDPSDPLQFFRPFGLVFWVFYGIFYVFASGLTVGMLSYAYKALKGHDARTPIET